MTAPANLGCTLPPDGWYCSRTPGHEGPCAARPVFASLLPRNPLSELLDEYDKAAQGFYGEDTVGRSFIEYGAAGNRLISARSAIEALFARSEQEVERLRRDGEICARDHSDAWEEIRRLRATSLTPEEAGWALTGWQRDHSRVEECMCVLCENLRKRLRSISGRSTKQEEST